MLRRDPVFRDDLTEQGGELLDLPIVRRRVAGHGETPHPMCRRRLRQRRIAGEEDEPAVSERKFPDAKIGEDLNDPVCSRRYDPFRTLVQKLAIRLGAHAGTVDEQRAVKAEVEIAIRPFLQMPVGAEGVGMGRGDMVVVQRYVEGELPVRADHVVEPEAGLGRAGRERLKRQRRIAQIVFETRGARRRWQADARTPDRRTGRPRSAGAAAPTRAGTGRTAPRTSARPRRRPCGCTSSRGSRSGSARLPRSSVRSG